MSTQLFVSGAAETWVGNGPYVWGGPNSWSYVGYSRRGISVKIAGIWEDIEATHASRMPADVMILGQEASASGIFVRYNESVVTSLVSLGTSAIPGGFDDNVAGTMAVSEYLSYPLLIYSPYGFKTAYGTMVPGFLFYAAILSEPYDVTLSIRPKEPSLGWRALPVFGKGSGNGFQPGVQPFISMRLYTNTMPSPMPTPA